MALLIFTNLLDALSSIYFEANGQNKIVCSEDAILSIFEKDKTEGFICKLKDIIQSNLTTEDKSR